MKYKLLSLDIDGTLRPNGQPRVPRTVADAVNAVQRAGVKIVVATGRGRSGIPGHMLRGIRPDYWICAAGAQVLDRAEREIATSRLTNEQMYALVDFFEDHELPLRFSFQDAIYAYLEYQPMHDRLEKLGIQDNMRDGEDQTRHLIDMPFSAFGEITRGQIELFQQKYGYLGLRFMHYNDNGCDILRADQDKASGLEALVKTTGIPAAACVAVGDGPNDCGILQAAGLGVCVGDGMAEARAAADRLCPPAAEDGIAALCRELWPAAFAEKAAPCGGAEQAPALCADHG